MDAAAPGSDPIYVNGRFLRQTLSGVQRFAIEITRSLGRMSAADPRPPELLAPPAAPENGAPPDTAGLPVRSVGRRSGQLWEQLELPAHVRNGLLINLGNTAPLRARRQLVVLHDAGIYVRPEAYSRAFRLWNRILQRLLLYTPTQLVTVSEFSRTELARQLRIAPERIAVIGEGADHLLGVAADESVLARHGLQPGRFVFAVGNLAAHKNLPGLGALARRLDARGIPLVISGGINDAIFRRNGTDLLPQPARYVGRVSDAELRALYEAAACFVFPSFYEGFGLPAGEAMACGCPVVAAAIPSLREVCGEAALFADPHRPDEIADAVAALLDDAEVRQRLVAAGLSQARRHRWDDAARNLLDLAGRAVVEPVHARAA